MKAQESEHESELKEDQAQDQDDNQESLKDNETETNNDDIKQLQAQMGLLDSERKDQESLGLQEDIESQEHLNIEEDDLADKQKIITSQIDRQDWKQGSKKINEGSQLFRTQKMAGLAMISQKATRQHLEELDEDLDGQQLGEIIDQDSQIESSLKEGSLQGVGLQEASQ